MKAEQKYLKVYNFLKEQILNGDYPFGFKLPSKRTIAQNEGVSVITAEHALNILTDEGYIKPKERSGYYVCFKESDSFLSAPITTINNHYLQKGGYSTFPFSVFAKTARSVLVDYKDAILTQSNQNGCLELKEAIAKYLSRSRKIEVLPEQIIIGSGAEYFYPLLVQFLGKNKTYAIESPGYKKIAAVYKNMGVNLKYLALGENGILSSELINCNADILHITPYRSYPTGITANASKRNEYLEWVESNNRILIEDDFESEFSILGKIEDTLFSLDKKQRVIYLNSFSKTISPAIRVGYMVLPQKLINQYKNSIGFYSCSVPVFEQLIIARLINGGQFERHINKIRRQLKSTVK